MQDLKEFGLGFQIIIFGSPFYIVLCYDIFNTALSGNVERILPIFFEIPIAIAFLGGFILMFTYKEKGIKYKTSKEKLK